MLGCIQSPKFRVIHRSLLFDGIEEHKKTPPREKQDKEPLLRQILDALEAKEEETQIEQPSKNIVDGEKKEPNDPEKIKKISKIVAVLEKIEQVHQEQRKDLFEANQDLEDP